MKLPPKVILESDDPTVTNEIHSLPTGGIRIYAIKTTSTGEIPVGEGVTEETITVTRTFVGEQTPSEPI